jgi:LicD family
VARLGRIEQADDTRISGWAFDTDQASCLVDLLLDDRPFVTVRADQPRPDVEARHGQRNAGFAFLLSARLADLIPAGSVVSARFQLGERLPSASMLKVGRGPEDLFTRIARGWAVNVKSGDIYKPIGRIANWTDNIARTYPVARDLFRSNVGRDLFVAYGTLLGLVRDGHFLPHDDDCDVAFVSSAKDMPSLARDFLSVASRLRELGMEVNVLDQGNFHLTVPGYHPKLDVFVQGLVGEHLIASQVYARMTSAAFEPARELVIDGTAYAIPNDPDAVLTATYGEWRIPDPYFQWRLTPETKSALHALQGAIRDQRQDFGF